MFIKRQQHPTIEFNPAEGQQEPTLVHYFSDRGDPFKSVLPLLIEGAGQEQERAFMVESPLSEVVDWTIELNKSQDFPDRVLVDEKHRPSSRRCVSHWSRLSGKSTESSVPSWTTRKMFSCIVRPLHIFCC